MIVGWLEIGRYGAKICKTCILELRERELGRWKSDHGRSQQYRRAVVEFAFSEQSRLSAYHPLKVIKNETLTLGTFPVFNYPHGRPTC